MHICSNPPLNHQLIIVDLTLVVRAMNTGPFIYNAIRIIGAMAKSG